MKRFGKNGLILVLVGGIAALAVSAGAVAGTKKKLGKRSGLRPAA